MRSLIPLFAVLVTSSVASALPTKVFYVGGYRASSAQMRCWEEGARRNSPGNYEFVGIPYPAGADSSYQGAVNGAAGAINRVVAEINSQPGRAFVIAGHSSGAAISNTIAERARGNIRLVDLDGFVPNAGLRARVPTTCWGARQSRSGMQSRNYGAMSACGRQMRVFNDSHCQTQWCLHFALVVKSTPANLGTDFVSRGYQGCDTNLDWLE